MENKKICIITDNKTGLGLAVNFKNHGFSTFLCISDDTGKMSNAKKHYIANCCDKSEIPFCLDPKSLLSLTDEKDSILFFVKLSGSYSAEHIDSFVKTFPQKTAICNCNKLNFKEATDLFNYFVKNKTPYLNAAMISTDAISETGAVFLCGGNAELYAEIYSYLEKTAAIYDRKPCVFFMNSSGTCNFINSVNDTVFRAMIDVMSDAVSFLHKIFGFDYQEIHDIFMKWNESLLQSFVTVMVSDILSRTECGGQNHLIDSVDGMKKINASPAILKLGYQDKYYPNMFEGTNDLHTPVKNMISDELSSTSKISENSFHKKQVMTESLYKSCLLSFIAIYDQALSLIRDYETRNNCKIDYHEVTKSFYAGEMISSTVLKEIIGIIDSGAEPYTILSDIYFKRTIINDIGELRKLVCFSIENGVSVNSLYSSLRYFDSFISENEQNCFLQLANDCLFDTGYARKGRDVLFSADWGSISKDTVSKEKDQIER